MSKKTRQRAIVEIVSQRCVPSQPALAEELRKIGIEVTQATLSRDIAELNLVKSKEGYVHPEKAFGHSRRSIHELISSLQRGVRKIEVAQNMVIVRTPQATAKQVGLALEELRLDNVMGNVAGLDTVLVITRTSEDAEQLKNKMLEMIH